MSSVPMANSGAIAGLGLVGCKADSERTDSPQPDQGTSPGRVDSTSLESSRHSGSKQSSDCGDAPSVRIQRSVHRLDASPTVDSSATAPPPGIAARANDVSERANGGQHSVPQAEPPRPKSPVPLHRVREVREQQGVSIRSMAKRMGVDAKRYRQFEDPHYDLTLTELHAVQKALDVPFADLLVDHEALSRPVEERAKMVKAMKTAVALRESKVAPRVERMARMLCDQLVDLMPELEEVSGWPQFGARRGQSALGKALRQPIDTSQLGPMD